MKYEKDEEFKEFVDLLDSIDKYDKRIESIKKSGRIRDEKGYLVENSEFIELKNKINYKRNRGYLYLNEDKLYSEFKNIQFERNQKLQPIKIYSADYIKNIIINLDCVLIMKELFKLVNINKTNEVSFDADNNKITLFLKGNEKIELTHRNLILDKYSFDKNISINNEIQLIFDSINNFFKFENNIMNKQNDNMKKTGYLLKKSWIDEWKNFSNYEYIKKN